jgi:O-antigen/teichoic acid export membrane protein
MLALSRQVVLRDKDALRSVSFNRMRRVGLRYKQFPKYSVAEALAQAAGLNLPIIVIAASAVGPEAGFLILAMRATQAPMSLIGSAVGQVFASTAPDAHRNNDLCNVTAKTIGRILKLAAGPMLFFSVVAPEIFVFVFGPEWDRAGELVRWMTPLLLIHMMASSIGAVLYITDQQRLAFILQLTGAVIRIGSVFVIAKIASNWLSEAYAVSGALFYSAYLVVGLRCAGVSVDLLGHEVRKAVAHVVIWVVCAILCLHAINFLL